MDIVKAYFDDGPRKICADCWQIFEQSDDYDTRFIVTFREAKETRQKLEKERADIRAANLAAGITEVTVGDIVVVKDIKTGEQFFYRIAATGKDRRGLPDVFDIPRHDGLASVIIGLFVGDTYRYGSGHSPCHQYKIVRVCTVAEWLHEGHLPNQAISKEFTNSESGVRGNPTHRRW